MGKWKHLGIVFGVTGLLGMVACSSEAPPEEPDSNAQALEVSPGAIIAAAGGILGTLACGETFGNPVGNLVSDLAGLPATDLTKDQLCNRSSLTNECKDYCETFNGQDVQSIVTRFVDNLSYWTFIPPTWAAKIYNLLASVGKPGPDWRANDLHAGVLQCATLIAWAALKANQADQACSRGSQCVTCDDTSVTTRNACLTGQTILWCLQALGVDPIPPPIAAASAGCTIHRLCSEGIMNEGCRRSCAASIVAASPVAMPVDDAGVTTRQCCTCTRETWEDEPLIVGGDELRGTDFYNSVVSENGGECTGRNGTRVYIAGGVGPDGYPLYYYYKNCQVVTVNGSKCGMSGPVQIGAEAGVAIAE